MSFVETVGGFHALGCEDQVKCALGVRVFLDLECDKRVTNLEKCYDSNLNLVYLKGVRNNVTVIFVPILSSRQLNFLDIENFQKQLIGTNTKNSSITLAICDTSSNILYYQVTPDVFNKK